MQRVCPGPFALMVIEPAAAAVTWPRTASWVTNVPVLPSLLTHCPWLTRNSSAARPAFFLPCFLVWAPLAGVVFAGLVDAVLATALTALGAAACAAGAPDQADAIPPTPSPATAMTLPTTAIFFNMTFSLETMNPPAWWADTYDAARVFGFHRPNIRTSFRSADASGARVCLWRAPLPPRAHRSPASAVQRAQ